MKAKNNKLLILNEPTNYTKPISYIDFKKWLEALKLENGFHVHQLGMKLD